MADKSLVYHIFAVLLQEIKFQSVNLRHMLITNQMVDGVESHKLEKSHIFKFYRHTILHLARLHGLRSYQKKQSS